MLEVDYILRRSYFTLLNGNVIYNSAVVPVFDTYANVNTPAPYIVLADINESDNSNKCNFGQNVRATIDIVTEFDKADPQGRYPSEQIANSVLQILLPDVSSGANFDLSPNFQNIRASKINGQTITEVTDTTKVFRKIIQINHNIKQL